MKTKDFIEMLQKEDPTGECHVRLPGGIPWFAERKEGYWDGPYQFIDEDGNFVISIKENKVDINVLELEDFIWENKGDYSKIKFEFDGYVEKEKHIQEYIERFEKIAEEYKRFHQQSLEHHTFQVLKKLNEGWKIREEKIGSKKYMMDYVFESGTERMCIGDCQAVHETELFESYDETAIERFWRLKNGS
jgi:hypothetical protein